MSGILQLRPAGPDDCEFLAWGLDEAADGLFAAMFGSRSKAVLAGVVAQPEHELSFQHATIATLDGQARGFCQGGPYGTRSADDALMRAAGVRALRAVAVMIIGRPVFAALGRHSPGEWYLQGIAVVRGSRGTGIGRKLLADALSRAGTAGCSTLTLDVDVTNPRARALYERLGLEVVSTSPRARLLDNAQVHRMSVRLSGDTAIG